MLYLHWLPLPQTSFICFLLCTCMSNCLCNCASFSHYFSCQDFVGILWKPNVRTLECYARINSKTMLAALQPATLYIEMSYFLTSRVITANPEDEK